MCDCNSTFNTLSQTFIHLHTHTRTVFCPCHNERLNYPQFVALYISTTLVGWQFNVLYYDGMCLHNCLDARWYFQEKKLCTKLNSIASYIYWMSVCVYIVDACVLSTKNNGSKSISFLFGCSNIPISIKMYVLINICKQPVRYRWRERERGGECETKYI